MDHHNKCPPKEILLDNLRGNTAANQSPQRMNLNNNDYRSPPTAPEAVVGLAPGDAHRDSAGDNRQMKATAENLTEKEHLHKFAASTDFHGWKHLVTYGSVQRKLFWLCILIGCMFMILYLSILTFMNFGEYHHITTMDIEYVRSLDFPAVTVCNFNKFRKSILTREPHSRLLDLLDIEGLMPHNSTTETPATSTVPSVPAKDDPNDYNLLLSQVNFTEFTYAASHDIRDMLVKCYWKGLECGVVNFTHVFTHYGNCYTFNLHPIDKDTGHLLTTRRSGEGHGLRLILNCESYEYTSPRALAGTLYDLDIGFKVMIHPQNEPPSVKDLGFAVAPGTHSLVAIAREEIHGLPKPYNKCLKDGHSRVQYYDKYSMSACREECMARIVVAECGCKLVEMPGRTEVCQPYEYIRCAERKLDEILDSDWCRCRQPCDVIQYPYQISTSKLNYIAVKRFLSWLDDDQILNNVAVINIFYKALNFETITQLPEMGLFQLFGTVGGQMGLFLGASLLSFVELFEFLLDQLALLILFLRGRRPYRGQGDILKKRSRKHRFDEVAGGHVNMGTHELSPN